jgi:hypothetical protein
MNERFKTQLPLIILLVGTIAGTAALMWWGRRAEANLKARQSWPTAEAQVIGHKSVRHDVHPFTSSKIIYFGELHIQYTVSGKIYRVWYPMGISSESESELLPRLEHEKISGHYIVHYDPKNPGDGYPYKVRP